MPSAQLLTVHLPDPGSGKPPGELIDWQLAQRLVDASDDPVRLSEHLQALRRALDAPDRAPLKRLLVPGYQVLNFWAEDGGPAQPAELYRAASTLAALGVFGERALVRDSAISA